MTGGIMIVLLIVRILITIYCVNKAKSLNRDTVRWGVFGFFLPILALIIIQFKKTKTDWDKN
jgi:hypothetical protein